jgi:hypothetical protein
MTRNRLPFATCLVLLILAFASLVLAAPQGPPSGPPQGTGRQGGPPAGAPQAPGQGRGGAPFGAPSGSASTPARHSAAGPVPASLLTVPERTNYVETSLYDDVMAFMRAASAKAPQTIHLTTFGYSFEGRALPLAVIGAKNATPEAVKATGKTRVYIQANIHAGEVEGKEACLQLLRAIANGQHAEWFKTTVLLIAPIFNPDGNDRIRLDNRGRQNGPIGGMGQRPNAQMNRGEPNNLDLNRDFMKMESPEDRSMALLYQRYDPHVEVSLHTTDGSLHAYQLTYNSPLHPATAASVMNVLRQGLLPAVTKAIKAKDGYDFYYYGNLPRGGAQGAQRVYAADTDLYTARFEENYIGLRNRLGILSETFAYLTFKDRIAVARRFVEEIVNYTATNGERIRKATADADKDSIVGKDVAILGRTVRSQEPVQILMGECEEERNPYTGQMMLRRKNVSKPETMLEAITFEPSDTVRAPRAYIIPGDVAPRVMQRVLDRLQAHGVRTEKLATGTTLKGEQFKMASTRTEERSYQGHTARTTVGTWEAADVTVPDNSIVVPVDQPLGRLVFLLLEPRSNDSLVYWNLFDDDATRDLKAYPVVRTMETIGGTTTDK